MTDSIGYTKLLTPISFVNPYGYFRFANDTLTILTGFSSEELPVVQAPATHDLPGPDATGQLRRDAWNRLSYRQKEVVAHALAGESYKEIACKLSISPYTVKDHMQSAITRAGVKKRLELARLFYALDLTPWLNRPQEKGYPHENENRNR